MPAAAEPKAAGANPPEPDAEAGISPSLDGVSSAGGTVATSVKSAAPGLCADAPEFMPGGPWPQHGIDPDWQPLLRGGYYSEESGWWLPFYIGRLKSFNARTGYGFLECEQTFQIYRTDVYVHRNQMLVPWNIGQHVEFAVAQNSRGQPQASDVNWLPVSAMHPKAKPAPGAGGFAGAAPNVERPDRRYLGTLKSYSAVQGYGFISSDDILEKHSCDVYLDRGQLPASGEWRPGQMVEFACAYNHRGQPQARSVNWEPVPHFPAMPSGATPPPAGPGGTAVGGSTLISGSMGHGHVSYEPEALRALGKILGLLHHTGKGAAVRAAVDLQEESRGTVDFVSFVLDRLTLADARTSELTDLSVGPKLLMALSKALRATSAGGGAAAEQRVQLLLAWLEALLPCARDPPPNTSFANMLEFVKENLQKAAENSQDRAAFEAALAALGEVSAAGSSTSAAAAAKDSYPAVATAAVAG